MLQGLRDRIELQMRLKVSRGMGARTSAVPSSSPFPQQPRPGRVLPRSAHESRHNEADVRKQSASVYIVDTPRRKAAYSLARRTANIKTELPSRSAARSRYSQERRKMRIEETSENVPKDTHLSRTKKIGKRKK